MCVDSSTRLELLLHEPFRAFENDDDEDPDEDDDQNDDDVDACCAQFKMRLDAKNFSFLFGNHDISD